MTEKTEKCFDAGMIQAFSDGELDADLLENVARHIAACENCALLLQEAESESAFAFSVLDNEFNALVPTERIRVNVYEAIAQIKRPRKSFWERIFGAGLSFSNPSIVTVAGLLLVAGFFAAVFIHRENQNLGGGEIAKNESLKSPEILHENESGKIESVKTTKEPETVNFGGRQSSGLKVRRPMNKSNAVNRFEIQRANYQPEKSFAENRRAKNEARPAIDNRPETNNENLIGEDSYVKTITTLTENVNSRKDAVLRPSERVAFEKDLAVVDDAIAKMRREVRKNPKNEAAKQVLRSSYQNKIDLLNSVADKNELMASLK